MKPTTPEPAPCIMIVDDEPENLHILSGMLEQEAWQVTCFPQGALALEAAKKNPPDLILMDICMPDWDGYETCRRFKEVEALRDIPILFLSALSEPDDKLKAFQGGGADYITKPFCYDEVICRVRVHLTVHGQKRQLESSYRELQEVEEMRDSLVRMIVHDMRTPTMVIAGALEQLSHQPEGSAQNSKWIAMASQSAGDLTEMIYSMLDISRLETGKLQPDSTPCDLSRLAKEATETISYTAEARKLEIKHSGDPTPVRADPTLIRRVWMNLLTNAVKFSRSGGIIQVNVSRENGVARGEVIDSGRGIPKSFHDKIFEKFGQVDLRRTRDKHSSGLGLTFCKLAVEAHGGCIGVESEVGQGSTFWFELPLETGSLTNRQILGDDKGTGEPF